MADLDIATNMSLAPGSIASGGSTTASFEIEASAQVTAKVIWTIGDDAQIDPHDDGHRNRYTKNDVTLAAGKTTITQDFGVTRASGKGKLVVKLSARTSAPDSNTVSTSNRLEVKT